MIVCLSVDVEPDCPPYLNTWRGLTEGLDHLLSLLGRAGISATFFTTGQAAQRFPNKVERIVAAGHELGCHGLSHRAFSGMDWTTAVEEIQESAGILRHFAPVASFRAPYLNFPVEFTPILEANGFTVDSSRAKYKLNPRGASRSGRILRVPVSATSSVLRLPRIIREPYLKALKSPVVLFVHPWEFVDFRRERLRLDCRFRTGPMALDCLARVIDLFRAREAEFVTINRLVKHG